MNTRESGFAPKERMRSHDQDLDVTLKLRKTELLLSKMGSPNRSSSRWPCRVAVSRDERQKCDKGAEEDPFSGHSAANESDVITCDIDELFRGNVTGERTICPQISSSTELGEDDDDDDVCSTCKNCAECHLEKKQRSNAAAKIRGESEGRLTGVRELTEHLRYYEGDVDEGEMISSSGASVSIEREDIPILVDLTNEESKHVTWEHTMLKQLGEDEESSKPESIMIADSSSRLQRAGTGNSLATALRDRGPCVIPVQPNRSLPIRPAPPMPTRSATSVVTSQKTHSPMLRLSKSVNVNVIEVRSNVSPISSLSSELNEFSFSQQDGKDGKVLASEFVDRPDYAPDVTQITKEIGNVKRKNDEDRDEREVTKETKKRKKSFHETEAAHTRDERPTKPISEEYSETCPTNWNDKGKKKPQQHVMVRLWDNKNCSSTIVVSTTGSEAKKTNEICKVVPPLRLKKVFLREVNATNEYSKVKVNNESGNESNYRIVTGATPRPESPSECRTTNSFWSNVSPAHNKEPDPSVNNARDKSRHSSPKSDGYKIKYRRNRLRQKLRELRAKALDLSREMAADTSPQRSTRLRQMMNCYEKQIENISKLLCKLSASIPPNDDIVDLDYENKLDTLTPMESTADVAQVNGISTSSVSPSSSPEPPKLSPRSPVNYEKSKSPGTVRDSPPLLPRVYIAIQPSTLESLRQNTNTVKSWHKSDSSSISSEKEAIKVNDTGQTIRDGSVTTVVSSVSSSEFERDNANWDGEVDQLELKSSKLEDTVPEDVKMFHDGEECQREATPSISDNFLISTMSTEMTKNDARDTTKGFAVQESPELSQVAETTAGKQVTCEKLELKHVEESGETLSPGSSVAEKTRKIYDTEYRSYDLEERIGNEDTAAASTSAAAQEATTTTVRQLQVPAANVTNILQLQSNYYGSSVAQDGIVFTGIAQNSKGGRKVTSTTNQPAALDPTVSARFTPSGSTVSSSNQQCVVLPNSCSGRVVQENSSQRNDGSRIMTEQFPTLGNWVARMSREKKQTSKSRSKLQFGVTLPTAETAGASGLETQKNRENVPNNAARNNIVNVAPQWNTERWQRQQHHQRQQQLYAATSSAAPTVRPGICPPISITQFYPPNYAIDPYGSAAFGYHSAMCSYDNYSYHSRLHAPSLSGYQIGPMQDSHAPSLRQMSHIDKRFPANLLDARTRHFAKDLLKYPGTLSTGNYQHAASGLEYDRLRATTAAATQNGSAAPACLPPLLLPPPPPLIASAQQTLARTSLAGCPTNGGQCSRNRIIPDMVAAAAAAAVVAAASFGRQQGGLPPYGRTDTGIVSGDIGGVINKESLLMANRTSVNRERLSQEQSVNGVNVDSRLNNSGYHQLQNLILDTLPYVKTDDYSQPPTLFADNPQEAVAVSSASTSTYKSVPIPGNSLTTKESTRKESRNCETPHLGKISRTLETMNNLECSNCGLAGSMFKCLGCEAVFYCDERCQTRHWSIHVEKCPKRMPKLKKLI